VLLPLGAGVAVLGVAVGRPDGLILPFMAFNPAMEAARENRARRAAALAACLDPAIEAQAVGPRHPNVAQSLARLAGGYVAIGDLAQAEALYQRALMIQEEALGLEHGDVALSLEGYTALLRKGDRAAEAAELEVRIRAIRTKAASTEENHAAGGESAPPAAADFTAGGAPAPSAPRE
jgi:tetratricopeptide (TPR) repeat protein